MDHEHHARSSLVMGLSLIALLLFTANFYQYLTQRLLPRLAHYAVDTPPRCERAFHVHTFALPKAVTRDKSARVEIHRADRRLAEELGRSSSIHVRPFTKFMSIEAEMRRLESELQAEEMAVRRMERRLQAARDAAAGRSPAPGPHIIIER